MDKPAYQSDMIHDDLCWVTAETAQNQDYSSYVNTNYREPQEKTRVGMTRWGGYSAPAALIDIDSELRHGLKTEKLKSSNVRTDCYDLDGHRTGFCRIPYGLETAPAGHSSVAHRAQPQVCRFQDQLAQSRDDTPCMTGFHQVTEQGADPHLPEHIIEPGAFGRRAIITRHNLRNPDTDNKQGKTKKLTMCNRPYLG